MKDQDGERFRRVTRDARPLPDPLPLSFRCGSLWPDHGCVSVEKCPQRAQVQASQPLAVLNHGKHFRKYTTFSGFTTVPDINSARVDQIVRHQRRGASVRTLATDVGRSNRYFDAHPFPYSAAGGPVFSRAGLIGRYNFTLGHLADEGLTQTNYEDAFFYLEEMKGQKMIPSLNIYESLIHKCHDGRRAVRALNAVETGMGERDLIHGSNTSNERQGDVVELGKEGTKIFSGHWRVSYFFMG